MISEETEYDQCQNIKMGVRERKWGKMTSAVVMRQRHNRREQTGRSTIEINKPRDELIEEQKGNDSLKSLYTHLGDGEGRDTPHYYNMKDGVLMRKWEKTPQEAETEGSKAYEQTLVPTRYHIELLCTAHEAPMAGHLGITKTYEKLTRHFYWPGII